MPFFLIAVAVVMIVAAYQNTVGDLFSAVKQDVTGFLPLGLAVTGTASIGFVPKLSPLSRMLVGLLLGMYVLKNWPNLLAGFQSIGSGSGGSTAASVDPGTQFATTGKFAASGTQIAGTTTGSTSPAGSPILPASVLPGGFDPTHFLQAFEGGFGGSAFT